MLHKIMMAAFLGFAPLAALAAGSDDSEPPTPTATTTECTGGQVWDTKTETCVDAQDSRLDDDTRFGAARELAYDGQYDAALRVLTAMSEQGSTRVLTYMGFANRKAGRIEQGMAFYTAALRVDPGNALARSYLGQGLVEQGEIAMAAVQLEQIVMRGGAGTWAEVSLRQAIETGITYSH